MVDHGAAPSMAGYLWQVVEACRRSFTAEADDVISIERHDDIARAKVNDTDICCEQLKYSMDPGTISEDSSTWWSTIYVWADPLQPNVVQRTLVARDQIKPGSLLAKCYPRTPASEWGALAAAMTARAKEAPNQGLAGAYAAWLALSEKEKRTLLESIEIVDHAPSLADSVAAIDAEIQETGVPSETVERVRNSFLGGFTAAVATALEGTGMQIAVSELRKAFWEASARALESGYYEFPEVPLDPQAIDELRKSKHVHVIPQLSAIGMDSPQQIVRAMQTWFTARSHRERIMNASPHAVADLRIHDEDLVARCQTEHDHHPASRGEAAKEVGRKVHHSCMVYQRNLGKTQPTLAFSQGSYHELSNTLRVRWHPGYPSETGGT